MRSFVGSSFKIAKLQDWELASAKVDSLRNPERQYLGIK